MRKKLLSVFVVTMFFLLARRAAAGVVINEFVSDPESGSEWVELWNNSSDEINLTDWKWTELAGPGGETEHESSPKSLNGSISPGGLFVFEMNSALNNAGDSISLYNGGTLEDRVTFGNVLVHSPDLAPPQKGKSGALIGGSWEGDQDPTKGEANPSEAVSGGGGEEEEGNETPSSGSNSGSKKTSSSPKTASAPTKTYTPKVNIVSGKVAHVGVPFWFEGTGTGETGGKITRGKYFWNFGDGDFRETKASLREKFAHTYVYPGEYTVVFDYYADSFSDEPVASAQTTIKVIEPKIIISRVGEPSDFFVEITNKTDSTADLSQWILLSAYKVFTFPKNTTLGAGKKIMISPAVSGFSSADAGTLKLMTPEREIIFDYSLAGALSARENSGPSPEDEPESLNEEPVTSREPADSSDDKGLSAFAFGGASDEAPDPTPAPSFFIFAGFILLLGGGGSLVYFIRRRRITAPSGEDFEILDE